MDEIKLNLDNLNETEKKQLMALVEKANKPKAWKPKKNEEFYMMCFDGEINKSNWNDGEINNDLYSVGNCFQTREQAEWTVEHLKVRSELQRFADRHNAEPIDWKNENQYKHMIKYYFDHLEISAYTLGQTADAIYFTSPKIAEQAIDFIGEDRLKKYYFGVDD